jgi:hypothetical protein
MLVKVGRSLNRFDDAIRFIDYTVEHYKQTGKPRTVYNPLGWTKCFAHSQCLTEPQGFSTQKGGCISLSATCLGGQAYANWFPFGTAVGADQTLVIHRTSPNTSNRVTNCAMWTRGVGTTVDEAPTFLGTFVRLSQTVVVTTIQTLDPFLLPIGAATSSAQPLAWRQIPDRQHNRKRDANEQYQRGYGTALDTRIRNTQDLDPALASWPDTMVVDVPVIGQPISRPPGTVPPHSASRSRRRTKEKKLIGQAKGALKTVLNVVTEAKDVVDAVYKALPAKRRKSRALPHEKAIAIYKHFGELDAGKAVTEIIKNMGEDAVFGNIGKLQARTNRRLSNRYGARIQIGMGPAL